LPPDAIEFLFGNRCEIERGLVVFQHARKPQTWLCHTQQVGVGGELQQVFLEGGSAGKFVVDDFEAGSENMPHRIRPAGYEYRSTPRLYLDTGHLVFAREKDVVPVLKIGAGRTAQLRQLTAKPFQRARQMMRRRQHLLVDQLVEMPHGEPIVKFLPEVRFVRLRRARHRLGDQPIGELLDQGMK